MSTKSPEIVAYNKMRRTFRLLASVGLSVFIVALGISAYMFNLATPPAMSDHAAYDKWSVDHQLQFLAEEAGRFYWTETHTALVFGGIAVFAFLLGIYFLQMLMVAKISRVTATAVLSEASEKHSD